MRAKMLFFVVEIYIWAFFSSLFALCLLTRPNQTVFSVHFCVFEMLRCALFSSIGRYSTITVSHTVRKPICYIPTQPPLLTIFIEINAHGTCESVRNIFTYGTWNLYSELNSILSHIYSPFGHENSS